jgi:hypothetical protein
MPEMFESTKEYVIRDHSLLPGSTTICHYYSEVMPIEWAYLMQHLYPGDLTLLAEPFGADHPTCGMIDFDVTHCPLLKMPSIRPKKAPGGLDRSESLSNRPHKSMTIQTFGLMIDQEKRTFNCP